MIARLEGKLVKLDTESALVQVGAVGYEVLLPGYCINALSGSIGSSITLCTMEYYEGSLGGGNLIPRIVGFLSDGEREFFNKFISVKGIGVRKALRSLTSRLPASSAVENGDDKTLTAPDGVAKGRRADYRKLKGNSAGSQSVSGRQACRRLAIPGGMVEI
jgi:Holliday junction DNA helicase RuvA